jgi:hypothetical protein
MSTPTADELVYEYVIGIIQLTNGSPIDVLPSAPCTPTFGGGLMVTTVCTVAGLFW